MKRTLLLLISTLSFICCRENSDMGINISCSVKNAEQEYVNLNYFPRMRGILNYDGFNSIGSFINSDGNLDLYSDKITDGANYTLEFKNTHIPLILNDGDNIHLTFDINNPVNSLIATGKGAGKINILNLKQFRFDNFDLEKKESLDEFVNHINNVISEQIALLNSIYLKQPNDKIISQAQNKIEIQNIITNSPLTEKEYNYLSNRINFQRYSLQTIFLSKITNRQKMDSIEIDFDNKAFKHFNKQEYQKLDNVNDWNLANSLESILQIEYLRKLVGQENTKVTYGNWQSFFRDSDYTNWVSSFLKENFNVDIYNKYYADLSAWLMTLGHDYKLIYEKLDTINQNNKYSRRLNEFENLLSNGLNNKDYGLNKNELTLDENKFNSLLNSYSGKPLLITFWSAQFAGASIVNNLPAIKSFEEKNKEQISMINICIDKKVNKKLWATRIIDNSWMAKHYFLPIEENDSILNNFSDKKISAFCDGGATYALIDKNGKINNGIKFPFHKSIQEIERTIKQKPFANNGYK